MALERSGNIHTNVLFLALHNPMLVIHDRENVYKSTTSVIPKMSHLNSVNMWKRKTCLKPPIDTVEAVCTQRPLLSSSPIPSPPFPSLFFSSYSTLPHSYLMVLLWCLPSPLFFSPSPPPVFEMSLPITLVTRRGSCGPKCPSPMKTV